MAGQLSSLGLGSGVLTSETLDKLKAADEAGSITPIKKRIAEQTARGSAISNLQEPVDDLKTVTDYLNNFSTYQERETTATGSAIDAEVGSGFPLGDMQVDVHQLASSSMFTLGGNFTGREAIFSKTGTSLDLTQAGHTYHVAITGNMKVGDVAQAITDATDGKIVGQVMKTNGPSPYKLVVKSSDTGASNKVYTGSHYASVMDGSKAGGELTINHGDMQMHLTDSSGTERTIDIADYLGKSGVYKVGAQGSSGVDNLEDISDALREKLLKDSDFKDIVVDPDDKSTFDRPLEIELRRKDETASTDTDDSSSQLPTGVELVLNDKRGGTIGIDSDPSSTFLKDVGLENEVKQAGELKGSKAVGSGHLTGKMTIGGVALDLSAITVSGNSSEDNAKAIASYLTTNGSGVVSASSDSGYLVLNDLTNQDQVQIILDASDSGSARAIGKLGFMPGLNSAYKAGYDTKTGQYSGEFARGDMSVAQDSKFSFNGMEMTRSKNKIDDILSGLTLTFKKETTSAEVVSVKRDTKDLQTKITGFFKGLQDMYKSVQTLTKSDPNAYISHANGQMSDEDYYKKVGLFSTDSSMRTLVRQLKEMFSFDMPIEKDVNAKVEYDKKTGERMVARKNMSLATFGITMEFNDSTKTSSLKLDEDKLKKAIGDNEEYLEKFFYGYDSSEGSNGVEKHVSGYFEETADKLHNLFFDPSSTFKSITDNSKTKLDSMQDEKKKATERLDSKYKTMQERWASYDTMINQMQQSFASLQSQINQSSSS